MRQSSWHPSTHSAKAHGREGVGASSVTGIGLMASISCNERDSRPQLSGVVCGCVSTGRYMLWTSQPAVCARRPAWLRVKHGPLSEPMKGSQATTRAKQRRYLRDAHARSRTVTHCYALLRTSASAHGSSVSSTKMSHAKCCELCPMTDGKQSARKSRRRADTSALMLPEPFVIVRVCNRV